MIKQLLFLVFVAEKVDTDRSQKEECEKRKRQHDNNEENLDTGEKSKYLVLLFPNSIYLGPRKRIKKRKRLSYDFLMKNSTCLLPSFSNSSETSTCMAEKVDPDEQGRASTRTLELQIWIWDAAASTIWIWDAAASAIVRAEKQNDKFF